MKLPGCEKSQGMLCALGKSAPAGKPICWKTYGSQAYNGGYLRLKPKGKATEQIATCQKEGRT